MLVSVAPTGSLSPVNPQQSPAVGMLAHGHTAQQQGPSFPATILGSSPEAFEDDCEKARLELELLRERMQTWMGFVEKHEVERWIVVRNTDLRAGSQWLLFVDPSTRRSRAWKY